MTKNITHCTQCNVQLTASGYPPREKKFRPREEWTVRHKTIGGLCQKCGEQEAARLSKLNEELSAIFFGKRKTK